MIRSVGVDGFAGGWVAVELHGGAFVRAWVASTLRFAAGRRARRRASSGVDMPLGLVDTGWRTADGERGPGCSGPGRASVFRGAAAAGVAGRRPRRREPAVCRELTGVRPQRPGLGAAAQDARGRRVAARAASSRCTPNWSSAPLAGGPLPYGKKTWNGQAARRALLARAGRRPPRRPGPGRRRAGRRRARRRRGGLVRAPHRARRGRARAGPAHPVRPAPAARSSSGS